jgi:hypothetical protein
MRSPCIPIAMGRCVGGCGAAPIGARSFHAPYFAASFVREHRLMELRLRAYADLPNARAHVATLGRPTSSPRSLS